MEQDFHANWRQRQQRILQILDPSFKEQIQVWNGHHKSGEYFYSKNWWNPAEERLRSAFQDIFAFDLSEEDFQRMEEAETKGTSLDPPVRFKNRNRDLSCPFCDQRLHFGYDGKRLVVMSDPCPYPNGLVTEWELNVPSGKIAIANSLRDWFPSPEDYSVNSLLGQHLTTLGYAKVGMSHGFVGNTCPHVYQSEDKFVIGSYTEYLWDDDAEEDYPNPEPCPWGEDVAGICTDLWWYSIVDHAELLRRVDHYTNAKIEWDKIEIIDVKPGVYRFRHPAGTNSGATIVEYATFEWVRDSDPLVDYVGQEKVKNFTALEVLIENCLSWPVLYMDLGHDDPREKDRNAIIKMWEAFPMERKISCLARDADHVMCTLGNGIEWHENGFPRIIVSEEARRLAETMGTGGIVPAFGEGRKHWYPISAGYGGLCLGAGIRNDYSPNEPLIHLAPSFVMLGLNICQSAILYGEDPRLNRDVWPPAFEIPFCRDRLKLFGRCYRGLRQRYPDLVFDEKFDLWMQEIDFDKHVANFNFGPAHPPKEQWGAPPTTIKQGDFFEFDAMKLEDGSFCWHPTYMSGWARKKDAQRYCLRTLANTQSEMGHIHTLDSSCRGSATLPLRVVGRVIRGTGEGYASKILEVAFDYGTAEMRQQRWGISEKEMSVIRQFSDPQEYQALLEQYKADFDKEEARIDELVKARNSNRQ